MTQTDLEGNIVDVATSIYLQNSAGNLPQGATTLDARELDAIIEVIQKQQAVDATKAHIHAAYLNSFIQEGRRQVSALMDGVETEEQAARVLPAVTRIYEQIESAAEQLDALVTDG